MESKTKSKDKIRKSYREKVSKINTEKRKKVNKKVKKMIKKVVPKKKRYVYNHIPIYTVKDICKTMNINIPKELEPIKNIPVHLTYLFDKLEIKKEIRENVKYIYYRRPNTEIKLKKKMRRFRDIYEEQINVLSGNETEMIQMAIEWFYVFNPLGFYYYDYFDYELYNRKIKDTEPFMSRAYWWKVYTVSNNSKYTNKLKDKKKFNDLYHSFIKREYFNIDEITFEEFKKFIKNRDKFFGKPINGTGGVGAGIFKVKDYEPQELYKICKKEHMIIEDVVKQHKDLAKFNKDTVNTLRVYSLLCADGKVRVMMANIRTGRVGQAVDNFHCGGMTAVIDVKTGIVASDAIDLHHNKVEKHPDSGIKFKGFKVPHWDKVVKAVEQAGLLLPQIRHIGWDIAISDKGEVEFIEGNSMPNFDVAQAPDQIGKKYIYEKYIDELSKIKEKAKK